MTIETYSQAKEKEVGQKPREGRSLDQWIRSERESKGVSTGHQEENLLAGVEVEAEKLAVTIIIIILLCMIIIVVV